MSQAELTIDNFRLGTCLATGRYTQVWEAIDVGSSRRVAMKLLLPAAFADPAQKQQIKFEAKLGKALDHPNIIKVHEISVNRNHAYLIMDLFRATNLKSQITGELNSVHLRIRKLIELTGLALEHMHDRGWLHKDVKPDNILLNRASEVRLIDFSLSSKASGALGKMVPAKWKTAQGTRTYMAPEQIRKQTLTPRTDLYSLGITIFECLTGHPPFRTTLPDELLLHHLRHPAPPPSDYNSNVTPEMDKMVLRMLAKKPQNRQKNMGEFLAEFRNLQVFKEEVKEEKPPTQDELDASVLGEGLDQRLNSRYDAMRSEALARTPNALENQPRRAEKKRPVVNAQNEGQPAPAIAHPQAPQPIQQPAAYQQPVMPQQPFVQPQWPQQMPGVVQPPPFVQPLPPQQPVPQQMLPQQPVPQPQQPAPPMQQRPPQQQPMQPPQPDPVQPPDAAKKSEEKEPVIPEIPDIDGTVMNIADLPSFDDLPDL